MAVTEISGTLRFTVPFFGLRFPLRFTSLSSSIPLYAFGSHPIPSAFTYEFGGFGTPLPSPLFNSKSSNFCGCYGSYRGSWHILQFMVPFSNLRSPPSIYGSLYRSTVPFSKTSNACITAIIAEVLAYIFRTILGAFSECFE
jgi:hypothetical protein